MFAVKELSEMSYSALASLKLSLCCFSTDLLSAHVQRAGICTHAQTGGRRLIYCLAHGCYQNSQGLC